MQVAAWSGGTYANATGCRYPQPFQGGGTKYQRSTAVGVDQPIVDVLESESTKAGPGKANYRCTGGIGSKLGDAGTDEGTTGPIAVGLCLNENLSGVIGTLRY